MRFSRLQSTKATHTMMIFPWEGDDSQTMSICKMGHKVGISEDKQNTLLLALLCLSLTSLVSNHYFSFFNRSIFETLSVLLVHSKIMELSGDCSSFLLFGLLLIPGKKAQYFQCYDTEYILLLLFAYPEVDTWKTLSAFVSVNVQVHL